MKALLLNEGYSDNLGDQAIRVCAQHALEKVGLEVFFSDLTRTIDKPYEMPIDLSVDIKKESWKVKSLIPKQLRWIIKNLRRIFVESRKDYDIAVIGGGQLILPNGRFPLAVSMWIILLKALSNTKVYVIGVGAENLTGLDKAMVKYALGKVDGIAVRDSRSAGVVKGLIGRKVNIIPDWAFLINEIYPLPSSKVDGRVLINVPHLYIYNRYVDKSAGRKSYYKFWVDCYLKQLNLGKEVFLFYTAAEDKYEAEIFRQHLSSEGFGSPEILDCDDLGRLLDEIKDSEKVISGRMHALILALAYGKEVHPYIISDKLRTFSSEYIGRDVKKMKVELMGAVDSIINS